MIETCNTVHPAAPQHRQVQALDITVLAGGPGAERSVSLESGRAVTKALERVGHRVLLTDVGPTDLSALDRPADILFIALHGEFGEDGQLQEVLGQRGLAFTGSGAEASRNAMNKVIAKDHFQRARIPTPEFAVARAGTVESTVNQVGVPCVVKPVSSGSSVHTTINRSVDQALRSANTVVETYFEALVERLVEGPELTVGILGDHVLPVCEIRTQREFYDYAAKYEDDDTQYLFDLNLAPELLEQTKTFARAAHDILGCRVFSRVDFMVDRVTQTPYVLEVNTIPGFTSHSLVPKAAARIGIGFDELCQRIVELSLGN